jgi:hypothetical protein
MTEAVNGHRPGGRATGQPPARVDSSTRVNLALPFSQIKIAEPSPHLIALTALVAELADLVADAVPGPQATDLRDRAHELTGKLR